ncbi:MAG: HEAT repeat domain-containing protein [Planctomycetota bacterium]|nr:HEAT repeat domain-containing protein [Planctomycetota bacterium]
MKRWYRIAVLGLAAALAAAAIGGEADEKYRNVARFEFGKSVEPLTAIEAEIRGSKVEQYKDIEAKLLDALKAPDAAVDGKRYLLRYLTIVGSETCVPAVARFLADEQLSHPARMALEALPCKAAAEALRQGLEKAKGKQLAGVVASLGVRRDAEATSALAKLTSDADPAVAEAAVCALGEVGTPEAAKALEEAAAKVPEALKRPAAKARVACAARLTEAGKGAQAAAIYKTLLDNPPAPSVRIAALRGMIASLDSLPAAKLIAQMLEGEDAALRTATLAAYSGSSDKALKDAVAAQLPGMKPVAQEALLGVLGGMPEVAARPALVKIIQDSKEESLRVAALVCLGVHGAGADVDMLVKLAAKKPESAETKAARAALDRLGKADVNDALSKMLDTATPAERAVILSVFATRRVEAALPALVKLMNGNDAAAALEAAQSIEVLGTAAEMPAVTGLLAKTADTALQKALETAATAICTRATDKEPCGQAVLAALDKATTPAARSALLRVTPRIKTESALAAVRKAMSDKDADVSEAATRTLTEWPESGAVPYLVELAKTTTNQAHAVLAIRGCLRLAGIKEKPAEERLGIYKKVLETAKRPDEKKQALAGVADLATAEALDLLKGYFEDKALGDDAANQAIQMAKRNGAFLGDKASAALEAIKAIPGASEQLKKAADEAIKAVKNTGQLDGFIIAWLLAGPYEQDNKGAGELFDIVFDPEKPDAKVGWRPVLAEKGAHPIALDKVIGGQNRVAYLKTGITSEMDQEVLLEVGSDDGVKVWLNGQVVHANNATRGCQEGQDKVKMKLKQGANTLLCKVTQGGGEWAVVARLRSAGGKEAVGTAVSPK